MRDYPTLHLVTNGSKGKRFYCCSTFHSHSTIYNKEHNPFPKMSVKRVRPAIEWYSLLSAVNATSGHMSSSDVIGVYNCVNKIISKKPKYGWSNLTNSLTMYSWLYNLFYYLFVLHSVERNYKRSKSSYHRKQK